MPEVAAARGLLNPFDALSALPHSGRFLKEHLQYFGNLGLAAAAYNAGARRVTDWLARRGKLPDETRQYVKIITGQEPERWTENHEIELALALPRQNPCDGVADLSRSAEPARVAVQLEAPVAKIIETARAASVRAAAEAKARRLAASLKTKRGRLLAKLRGGKGKTKVVAEKAADKPKGTTSKLAAKLPPKIATKIADRVTDKPKGSPSRSRVRLAETTTRR
jgi:soluble lytic murein transglycosylase-like protein